MESRKLLPGGRLQCTTWVYDTQQGRGRYVTEDVSNEAFFQLFEQVDLAEGVTLRDIFLLLKHDPRLIPVFRRDFAEELVEEALALSLVSAPATVTREDPRDRIEWLEIYPFWEWDSELQKVVPWITLGFHGIGIEQPEDYYVANHLVCRQGHRIQWSVSLTPPAQLLGYPVKLLHTPLFDLRQDTALEQLLENRIHLHFTLGDILRAVLYELSFFGAGASREAVAEDLERRLSDREGAVPLEGEDQD